MTSVEKQYTKVKIVSSQCGTIRGLDSFFVPSLSQLKESRTNGEREPGEEAVKTLRKNLCFQFNGKV